MSTMDDALNTFVAEGRELLEQMEESLLQIEQAPDDAGLINAIFRAAHTIKGSAGIFGIDYVVAFTHVAENVLDRVRAGNLTINSDLVALLLAVRDHLGRMLDHVAARSEPDAEIHGVSERLVEQLRNWLAAPPESAPRHEGEAAGSEVEIESRSDDYGQDAGTELWHISARFNIGILRIGLDPIAIIRYLGTFGKIERIVTLTASVPTLEEIDPEGCYLGFEFAYRSDADKAAIENAFEYVAEDARIRILPPHSKHSEYKSLIDDVSGDDLRLGDILVHCGTLTQAELEEALVLQATIPVETTAPPLGEVLVQQKLVQPEVVDAALDKQKQLREKHSGEAALIRVNAEKLDQHINLIGELIIASAGINLAAARSGQPELQEAASLLNRLVEDIRDSALQLRMVQIGATFNKFQRVVRDVSKEIGKDIRLEIAGAETELDKTVVERIGDPLTHLVRNSMDHGIESAELRRARGKPGHGTLKLNAYHDSGSIVIEVADDGGGLPRDKILAKAIERGLVKPEQVLSDSEIHALIFEPGFSTAEQVNNLSGRGVGMDVVRRNIVALRGSIEIESSEGVGTTIRIRLPLTLAIIDGFLVGVGDSSFVVPLEMVVECVELSAAEIEAAQGRNQLDLRGEVLPFIRLRDLFEIPQAAAPEIGNAQEILTQDVDEELAFLLEPVRRENVVVVDYAGRRAGLVVDMLQGEYQTVIRPLGAVFNGLQGISGFTILGSGQVALILDVPGLVRRVAAHEGLRKQLSLSEAC